MLIYETGGERVIRETVADRCLTSRRSMGNKLQTGKAQGVYADLATLVALKDRARGFNLQPRQLMQFQSPGAHAPSPARRGLNARHTHSSHRRDGLRQNNGNGTAHPRKPSGRVTREQTTLLVVDQRFTMFFGSVKNMKSVTAAEVAALAAWRGLAQKDRV